MRGQVYSRRLNQPAATAKSLCSAHICSFFLRICWFYSSHLSPLSAAPTETWDSCQRLFTANRKIFTQLHHISIAASSLALHTFHWVWQLFLRIELLSLAFGNDTTWTRFIFQFFNSFLPQTWKNKIYANICISKPVRNAQKWIFKEILLSTVWIFFKNIPWSLKSPSFSQPWSRWRRISASNKK
jgi:hypothetical protein